jgi:P-type Cu2+ transporter
MSREDDALRLAAAVERDSEHPIAQALLKSAQDRNVEVPHAEKFSGHRRAWRRGEVEGAA